MLTNLLAVETTERTLLWRKRKSYVIFLCTGDPFGKRLPIYRFENLCIQDTGIKLTDSAIKIVINPDSEREGLSEEMNEFLNLLQGKAVKTGLAKKLSDAVEETKERGERRGAYMDMIQKLQEEYDEGVNSTIEMFLKSGMSVKEIHDRTNLDIARIEKIEESLLVEA